MRIVSLGRFCPVYCRLKSLYYECMYKVKKDARARYICPFCKSEIVSSKKTEIYYRSRWIKGCNDCFDLSIGTLTNTDFQTKLY